uniref:Uncharacterized protein n=1 Tax=Leersia perrieri TaxID=77586 RepID=A0A0D9V4Y0_9ORYZ
MSHVPCECSLERKNEAKNWFIHMKLLAAAVLRYLHQGEPAICSSPVAITSPGHACKMFGRMPHRVLAAGGTADRKRARHIVRETKLFVEIWDDHCEVVSQSHRNCNHHANNYPAIRVISVRYCFTQVLLKDRIMVGDQLTQCSEYLHEHYTPLQTQMKLFPEVELPVMILAASLFPHDLSVRDIMQHACCHFLRKNFVQLPAMYQSYEADRSKARIKKLIVEEAMKRCTFTVHQIFHVSTNMAKDWNECLGETCFAAVEFSP